MGADGSVFIIMTPPPPSLPPLPSSHLVWISHLEDIPLPDRTMRHPPEAVRRGAPLTAATAHSVAGGPKAGAGGREGVRHSEGGGKGERGDESRPRAPPQNGVAAAFLPNPAPKGGLHPWPRGQEGRGREGPGVGRDPIPSVDELNPIPKRPIRNVQLSAKVRGISV